MPKEAAIDATLLISCETKAVQEFLDALKQAYDASNDVAAKELARAVLHLMRENKQFGLFELSSYGGFQVHYHLEVKVSPGLYAMQHALVLGVPAANWDLDAWFGEEAAALIRKHMAWGRRCSLPTDVTPVAAGSIHEPIETPVAEQPVDIALRERALILATRITAGRPNADVYVEAVRIAAFLQGKTSPATEAAAAQPVPSAPSSSEAVSE